MTRRYSQLPSKTCESQQFGGTLLSLMSHDHSSWH